MIESCTEIFFPSGGTTELLKILPKLWTGSVSHISLWPYQRQKAFSLRKSCKLKTSSVETKTNLWNLHFLSHLLWVLGYISTEEIKNKIICFVYSYVFSLICPPPYSRKVEFSQDKCTVMQSRCVFLYSALIPKGCSRNFAVGQLFNRVQLFAIPWIAAFQTSLSFTIFWSLFSLMSNESVMPSNRLILCHPQLLLPSISPSSRILPQWVNPLHQVTKISELQL